MRVPREMDMLDMDWSISDDIASPCFRIPSHPFAGRAGDGGGAGKKRQGLDRMQQCSNAVSYLGGKCLCGVGSSMLDLIGYSWAAVCDASF